MIRLDIDDRFFHVQFRHARNLTRVRAITTCVIVAESRLPVGEQLENIIRFTAIGNAVCWPPDQFSRRRGRLKAFANALDHCAPLADVRLALFSAYMAIDPDPPPPRPRVKLDERIKKARWEAGWELRQKRGWELRQKRLARRNYQTAVALERAEGQR